MSKEKPYNNGTWTKARMRGFLIGALRQAHRKWGPRQSALKAARNGKLLNPKTGRENIASDCAGCGKRFLEKEMELDHINEMVPLEGFKGQTYLDYDWNEVMQRMFCEIDGYQALCHDCHQIKTQAYRAAKRGK